MISVMVKIVQKENLVLRQKAKEVPKSLIGTGALSKIISDMKKALDGQDDGVAIAAPQIGVSYRIFVVSGKIFHPDFSEDRPINQIEKKHDDIIFINPKITKLSKRKRLMPEGCLSVRWIYGNVERSTQATISALDEGGKKFVRGASGILAQIFQHETDHLDGVLFIDKAQDMEEVPPEKISKS